jgi:multidrug efflux pump
VPLSAFSHFDPGNTPLAVNHPNLFVASTISFNLAPNVSFGDAAAGIEDQMRQLGGDLSAPDYCLLRPARLNCG